jgi:hypothetical protein
MPSIRYFPLVAVAVTAGRLLARRIRFPKNIVGKLLKMEDGEEYFVFSDVEVASSKSHPPESMAMLRVRFKFDRYSDPLCRRLFLIFTPIITGMPGFQRKIWSFCKESGYYQGIYQFDSMELAERYRKSYIIWIMEKRSVPGSISCELLPDSLIEDYLSRRLEL